MPDDRVVLITGTRKGIGRFLVEHFLQRGCRVIGCSRRPVEEPRDGYRHFALDVTDEAALKQMLGEIRRDFGGLDILINNAGIGALNHALLTPSSMARQVFETNVIGTFQCCREAARLMRGREGRIVNFTTVAVPFRLPGEAVYAASKAAVESLTRVLAFELASLKITVNAVGPGPIRTDLIRAVTEDQLQALLARQAIPRLGEFTDVANVIDFFVRPESHFVTGQIVYLGGA